MDEALAGSPVLVVADDDGETVTLDGDEAGLLLALTDNLDPATVSACPDCRSRVVAVVALIDLLADVVVHSRATELCELAEDAPTLHLYVHDLAARCRHPAWRDPGFDEWADVVADLTAARRATS